MTRPTAAMRDAISRADVGDDVFGEDPTVRALEAETARLTGKEAALFVTSGTMANQLAIALQTRPGDEVIVGEGAHVYFYESGAGAAISGVQFAVAGTGGLFDVAAMEERIQPRAHWSARTSLVCVENTHNRAGGRIFPQTDAVAIAEAARSRGFAVHLDGARVWNASAATGLSASELCAPFDTISVCFSKGLGAPAGSALCASKKLIDEARFFRKRWGGGMRQSGILAAGALFALEHHRERLREDHYKAKKLAERLSMAPGASVDVARVETNIVNIDLEKAGDTVAKKAAEAGVLINASGPKRLRAVLHLDVSPEDAERAGELLAGAIANA